LVLAKALPGASGSLALERMQKDRRGGKWGYIGLQPGGKMEIPDHCNLCGAKAQGGNLFRACGSEAI
jgi:hypothetical protein